LPFSHDIGRVARKLFVAVGVCSAAMVALGSLTHPAAASAVLAAVQSAVSCASTGTTPCVSGTNTSSGIGVLGSSNTGTGLRGSSSTNNGLKATSTSGDGVLGESTSNTGVSGSSTNGYGVAGSSTNGAAGVIGTTAENAGVFGKATDYGNGVSGQSSQGYGVYGTTANGTGTAIFGYESSSGTGVYGESGGGGTGGFFESSYEAVVGQSSGYPLVGRNASGIGVFYVDGNGDIIFSGGLMQFSLARSANVVRSFTAKMTLPTVEDTGTAQLVGGAAVVRLDPTFAASIEPAIAYRVFLTPDGDSRGLFVASKTGGGFIVREAQGGRSTMSFDYRIVATVLGQAGQHMVISNAAVLPHASRTAPLPVPRQIP
jgi:hypothetical protein